MKIYIEAYRSDGTQILGNLDGQGVLHAKQYKRTNHYKHLHGAALPNWPKWTRPSKWHIVTEDGTILETIRNKYST